MGLDKRAKGTAGYRAGCLGLVVLVCSVLFKKKKKKFLLGKDRLSLKLIGAIYFLTTNKEESRSKQVSDRENMGLYLRKFS